MLIFNTCVVVARCDDLHERLEFLAFQLTAPFLILDHCQKQRLQQSISPQHISQGNLMLVHGRIQGAQIDQRARNLSLDFILALQQLILHGILWLVTSLKIFVSALCIGVHRFFYLQNLLEIHRTQIELLVFLIHQTQIIER